MTAFHEEQIGSLRLEVHADESPESPREWGNLGKMFCFHKRYTLGDTHVHSSAPYAGWDALEAAIVKYEDAVVCLPLYLYDLGQVGFIIAKRADVLKEYDAKRITASVRARAEEALCHEIKAYDMFLQGDVYGFIIKDGDETIDSCCGYYGLEAAIEEGKLSAERINHERG